MPIDNIQPRLREVIRIRMGQKVPAKKKGETRPAALDTWRLTSQNRDALEKAADLWGGEVKQFSDPGSTDTWEVVLETNVLPCVIPPIQGFSQWYELWSGGGCQRRCTGVREVLTDSACMCPDDPAERLAAAKEGEACRPSTRVTVVLHDLGAYVGARLETHGYYASTELAVAEPLFAAARANRTMIPAQLRLAQRTVKRPGQPPNNFVVPELLFSMAPAMAALGMAGVPAQQLGRATEQAALPAPDPSFGMPPKPIEIEPPAPAGEAPAAKDDAPSEESPQRDRAQEIVDAIFAAGMRDEEGAAFISLVTNGRGTSPKILNQTEDAAARGFLTLIERRQLDINFEAEGGPCFIDATTKEPLHVHHSSSAVVLSAELPAPDWRARARAAGVTWSAFLRRAKEEATALELPAPTSSKDITDEDLVAVLGTWLDQEEQKAGAPA